MSFAALVHQDPVSVFLVDDTVRGHEFNVTGRTEESRRSPRKAGYLRGSLEEQGGRQRNRQFYLTKPACRATGDHLLIPRLFAESFDASSAA